jgi:uncharacterized protein
MRRAILFIITGMLLVCDLATAQHIRRRGYFGINSVALTDSIVKAQKLNFRSGILVSQVLEQGTAGLLKLKPNDIITEFNGKAVETPGQLSLAIRELREGDPVTLSFWRSGKQKSIKGKMAGYPKETADKYDIIYDEVAFRDGYLRVIINKPKTAGKHKAILFIPGYMCYSLDNIGKHPYGQVVQKLSESGYVVMRVEKPGEGDCYLTPDCREIGFETEVDAFASGLAKIKTYDFVDTSNVFVFGHSLGGMEAPAIAARYPVKGVIVGGTSANSWFEYILAMFRFQNPITGMDIAENEDFIHKVTPLLYEYLVLKKKPSELSLNPEWKQMLIDYLQYDGADQIWSRHYSYWQELQDFNQAACWKKIDADVLVIRGEGDFEAFSTEGHQAIADMVNKYHPGKGTFILLPETDHAFCKSKTPAESFTNGQVQGYYYSQFNDQVIREIDQWIRKISE